MNFHFMCLYNCLNYLHVFIDISLISRLHVLSSFNGCECVVKGKSRSNLDVPNNNNNKSLEKVLKLIYEKGLTLYVPPFCI